MRALWPAVGPGRASLAAVAIASLVLVASAGCTSSKAEPDDEGLGAGEPKVGACRVLTTGDIVPASNQTRPVSCTRPHTAQTIAVAGFPAAAVTQQRVANGAVGNDALRRCTQDWASFVGGDTTSRHLSLFGLAYYLPDRQQLSDGARWYRCDIVLGGEDGLDLQDLPDNLKGVLDRKVPDSLLRCRTAPDFDSGRTVPCSEKHVLRAIGTAKLPGGETFPGSVKLEAASARACAPVIDKWLGGKVDGGDAYEWPDQTGWEIQGDHVATCWTVTTN